jgi:glycerophosphoryl diester phosphodiesterase
MMAKDWRQAQKPLIIGHRGASAEAPENTLAAFALALDQEADGIELDVRLSADGHVVVIHDRTVDRTTNARGKVSQLSLAALKSLNAGAGQAIPTLDELFATFGPHLLYNVEIKGHALGNQELEIAVADRIAAYHLENQVLVSSFSPLSVHRSRRHLTRNTLVGHIRFAGWQQLYLHLVPAAADHPHYHLVNENYMAWALKRNRRVHVWTVDDPTDAQRLARMGVHGIITNRPGLIRDCLT